MPTKFNNDEQRPIDIILMGRVAVDLYAEQVGSPLEDAQSFRKYLGGCAGNIAMGTARLGLKSSMFSYVGSDDMGKFLYQTLVDGGVDTTLLRKTDDHLTGLVLLGVEPPDRFPLIFYRENCADMQIRPEDVDEAHIKSSKSLLVTGTGLSKPGIAAATHRAVDVARAVGTRVIMDLDYRPVLWGLTKLGEGELRYRASQEVSAKYREIVPKLDLMIGTEEEVLIAGGADNILDALKQIRAETAAPIVLKRGAQGCEIYLGDLEKPITAQPYPVNVLNVLGAGDSFMSGLLFGVLRGKSWQECARYGNACGAITVSRHGCAPAMPTRDELDYFIKNYSKEENILAGTRLNLLHCEARLGLPGAHPLHILAMDHRIQFEKCCDEFGQDYKLIKQFKEKLYTGFQQAVDQYQLDNAAILVDPIYGETVLRKVTRTGIAVGSPIEKAGSEGLNWIYSAPVYEQILKRPSSWFVKVLWRYHREMDTDFKRRQLHALKHLAKACESLERHLMLELIVPGPYPITGDSISNSMKDVYQQDIYPFWWKLPAVGSQSEWKLLCEVIDGFDPVARIVILGGEDSDLKQLGKAFSIAKGTHHGIGFAIGRTVFWKIWLQLIKGEITPNEIPPIIAERYAAICKIWEKA